MSALARLGAVSRAYEQAVAEYGPLAVAAAEAEAAHKSARAKAILAAKAERERVSHAEAEARAEADDTIADLYQKRLITAALADAHKEKLRQLNKQVEVGRTAVASEREQDRLHADGVTGAA